MFYFPIRLKHIRISWMLWGFFLIQLKNRYNFFPKHIVLFVLSTNPKDLKVLHKNYFITIRDSSVEERKTCDADLIT